MPNFKITPVPLGRSSCRAEYSWSNPGCDKDGRYEIEGDWLDEDGEPKEIYYCEKHYAEFVARVMEQFVVTGAVKPNN